MGKTGAKRFTFCAVLILAASGAVLAQEGSENYHYNFNVKWADARPTILEKVAKFTHALSEEASAKGKDVMTVLKENGLQLDKAFSLVKSSIAGLGLGNWVTDDEDIMDKFERVGAKVQQKLENTFFESVKQAGASMAPPVAEEAKKEPAKSEDKKANEEKENEEKVERILEKLRNGDIVESLSQSLQAGLSSAGSQDDLSEDKLRSELSETKMNVQGISNDLTELYENGMPVEDILQVLEDLGLKTKMEHIQGAAQVSHDEL